MGPRSYDLQLRRTLSAPAEAERIVARDEAEARTLALLRLQLTADFAQVVLSGQDGPIAAFTRDSLKPQGVHR